MKLNFDYNNGRGHFEVDLKEFFPNTKGNTKRLLEVFQLSENAYELAEKAHGYLVETVKTLQADRAEARLKNNQKKVVSITTEIKKLLSCADVFSSEYGFEVLTDADAECLKMKKVDVYALKTNENGESEIKVVSGYEFKKGGYTFHVYKEKLSKTSRIHIIFPSCGAAINNGSVKTFKDAPEYITDRILKSIEVLLKSDRYKQLTEKFKNAMEKSGYEITEPLKLIEVFETKIEIKKEENKETVEFKGGKKTMANITINQELNGIEVKFENKPSRETLEALKKIGFRWHNQKKIWYAKQTEERLELAKAIVNASDYAEQIGKEEPKMEKKKSVETINLDGIGTKKKNCYGADFAAVVREELKNRGVKGVTVRARKSGYTDSITVTVKATAGDFASLEEAGKRYPFSLFSCDVDNRNGIYTGGRYLASNQGRRQKQSDLLMEEKHGKGHKV